MIATLIGVLFLAGLVWTLLRLRDLRERTLDYELPGDRNTILLGLFLLLSKAALQFHRDRGSYPLQVSGSPEGLLEAGYLDNEPLARMTKSIHIFSIVATESSGSAVCLINTPAGLAMDIINRVDDTTEEFMFFDMRGAQFIPITPPITHETVNLSLLLPEKPLDLSEV